MNKMQPGRMLGESYHEFRKRKAAARKAGTIIPGQHGGSRWDGRKKVASRKKGTTWVNHQGRETIMSIVFGMLRSEKSYSDAQIIARVKRAFPDAGFHNDPAKQLRAYRSLERKDKALNQ